jgi:CrcB protein
VSGVDGATGRYEQVIDPDVDPVDPSRRSEHRSWRWDVLLATAVGGVLGAEARYGLDSALPHAGNAFPWSTVLINVSGCLLIGALMVLLLELTYPHRLARPFLGVGVLGGYTTYSTFAVDVLMLRHRPLVALGYLGLTVLGCAAAVWLSTALTLAVGRAVIARRSQARSGR